MKKTLKKIGKIMLISLILIVVVAGGGIVYLRYTSSQSSAATLANLQTVKLAMGSINTTVSATGSVRTKQTAEVAWQAKGRVGTVAVKVGDKVKANDVLANLDPKSLPNNIITAQQDLVTAEQSLVDLKSNKADLPTAEKAFLDALTAVDDAQKSRNYLNYPRGTAGQGASAEASYLLAQQKVNHCQSVYDSTPGDAAVDASKALALSNLEAAKTSRDSAEYNMEWMKAPPSASDIASADNKLALAKAKLIDAQSALDKIKNGPERSA